MPDVDTVSDEFPDVDAVAEREIVPLELRDDVTVEEEHALAVLGADVDAVVVTVAVLDTVGVADVEAQSVVVEDAVEVTLIVKVTEPDAVVEALAV